MPTVREAVIAVTWYFLALLYRAVIPAYIILDTLANNLNDLRIMLAAYEIYCGCTPPEEYCKARGITHAELHDDLRASDEMDGEARFNAIATAFAILVGILGMAGIIIWKIIAIVQ
jgi:hypothetical protein